MNDPQKHEALRELADAVCEGRLSPAEQQRLESMLLGNPEAQDYYLRRVRLHAALRWDLRGAAEWAALKQLRASARASQGNLPNEGLKATVSPPPRAQAPLRSPQLWSRRVFALASMAAAACLAWVWFMPSRNDQALPPAPLSTMLVNVAFFEEGQAEFQAEHSQPVAAKAVSPGDVLGPGQLHLRRGLLRLDFTSGASVTLEGPAALSLLAADHARLDHGRLTAIAPPEAAGFTIDTPTLTVIDHGTVFGVAAQENGAAEVLVFDGEVQLALADSPRMQQTGSAPQRLVEGGAARAAADGSRIETIEFDGRPFSRSWPIAYGVLAATGVVKFVEPAPFIVPQRYEDTEHLIVFPEREAVWLEQQLAVTVAEPGSYAGPFEHLATDLPAGTRVRTYLLQFNPVGRKGTPVRRMQGSVTFDRPILGLICTNKQLVATDATLGAEQIETFPRGARGVEDGDALVLSHDRRTLSVDFTAAPAIDQIRLVLDAAPDHAAVPKAIVP